MSDLPKVQLSKLAVGTKLLVETEMSVYEVTLLDSSGKCMISGSNEFLEETEILLIGSTGYKGFIVFGEGLDFAYSDKDGQLGHGHTSAVNSCRLTGTKEDGTKWHYEVWETANEDSSSS
jgi:hypothetical protein